MKYNHRTQKHKKNKPRRSTTRRKGGKRNTVAVNQQIQEIPIKHTAIPYKTPQQPDQQVPKPIHELYANVVPTVAPIAPINNDANTIVSNAEELVNHNQQNNELPIVTNLNAPPAIPAPIPEQQEQPQIQPPDAPTLDKLKQTVSEYTYSYLKGVLRTIADGDLHRRYTDATETDTIFVFVLSEIINTLDAEIAELMDTYSSGTYTFGPNDRDRVVQELEAYKRYFQTYQLQPPEVDRVNLDYHEALFH